MLNYRYDLKKLLNLLEESDELELFIRDIFRFNLVCDENYGVREILFDERVAPASKQEYFQKVFAEILSPIFKKFVLQLIENNDLHFYQLISEKFVELISREKNSGLVEVQSAVGLSTEQQNAIKAEIERLWQTKIYVYNTVTPKILGGFIIKSGEKMLDFSLLAGLDKLRAVLAH